MDRVKITIIVMIIVAIAIILLGVGLMFKPESGYNDDATIEIYTEQVEDLIVDNDIVYDTDNMMLINDYDTFYTLEKIIKDIVKYISTEEYEYVLANMSEEFLEKNSINEVEEKLKEVNTMVTSENYSITDYSKLLYQVYERNSNEYDCLLNIENDMHYILIYLDKDNMTYEIRDFILSEEIK